MKSKLLAFRPTRSHIGREGMGGGGGARGTCFLMWYSWGEGEGGKRDMFSHVV